MISLCLCSNTTPLSLPKGGRFGRAIIYLFREELNDDMKEMVSVAARRQYFNGGTGMKRIDLPISLYCCDMGTQ